MRDVGVWGLLCLASLLLAVPERAAASVTASIVVNGTVQGADASTISISFSGVTESVTYDRTSTPQSIANAFAIELSRAGYHDLGLCAAAKGNVINLKLKFSTFSNITIVNPNSSFSFVPSGFLSAGPGWTKTFTLSNVGNANATIRSISLAGPNAADFTIQSTDCLGSQGVVASGLHCAASIAFTPTAPGVRTANLVILTDGLPGTETIALSGGQ